MKAAFIQNFGGPAALTYGDLPDPTPGQGQVLIDVAAASINAADWKVTQGEYNNPKFPVIIGRDFSGTVAAVGAGVGDLKVGDEVFGVCDVGTEAANDRVHTVSRHRIAIVRQRDKEAFCLVRQIDRHGSGVARHRQRVASVGSGVAQDHHFVGGDRPIALDAGPHADPHRVPRARCAEPRAPNPRRRRC